MILFLPVLKMKVLYGYPWKTRFFSQLSYIQNLCRDTFKYKLESSTCVTCSYAFGFFSFKLWSVWWAGLGGMPDLHPAPHTHSAVLSLPLLHRTGRENKVKKLMGQDKDTACVVQRGGGCSQSITVPL